MVLTPKYVVLWAAEIIFFLVLSLNPREILMSKRKLQYQLVVDIVQNADALDLQPSQSCINAFCVCAG